MEKFLRCSFGDEALSLSRVRARPRWPALLVKLEAACFQGELTLARRLDVDYEDYQRGQQQQEDEGTGQQDARGRRGGLLKVNPSQTEQGQAAESGL